MSTQIRGNKQIKNITIQNSQLADGTIELDKLKDGSELIKRDGSVAVTGDFDFGSHQIKNLAAPVDDNDAVRKADLDAVIGGSIVTREIPVGATNGSNTQFTLANVPNIGTEQVFLNGALLNAGANSDYVIENDTITFTIPPQAGDAILVNYISDMIVVSLDINTSINQLNSRLTTAEGELFAAQNDITSLDSDLSGVDSRLTSAEADIVAVEGDVATLQSSLSSVQSSVSSLTSDLSDEQAARIAADDALDTTVSSIQTSVTSLGNRMTAAEGDITALEAADAAFDLRAGVIEDGLQAETNARTSADSALSSRVTALENAPDPVTALSALTDVSITSPSADQILKYNGTGWVNGAAPATFSGSYNDLTNKPTIPSAFDDLSDVEITSLSSGQFIRYDGTGWKNYTIPNAGMGTTGLITSSPQTIDGEKYFYKKSQFGESISGPSYGTLTVRVYSDSKALVVRGNSSQTQNLFEVQNGAGSSFITVDSAGMATFSGGGWNKHAAAFTGAIDNPGSLSTTGVYMGTNGGYGWLRLMGSNTGILDFGTTNSTIYRSRFIGQGDGLQIALGYNNYKIYLGNLANVPGTMHVLPMTTSSQGIVIKGLASQTGNLFETQNSSGTVLFSIDKDGSVAAGTVPVARVTGLATVATSGSYADLTNKPSLFSGSYNDLTDKPSIPSLTQVEADIADHETRIVDLESTAFVTREVPSGSVNGSNAVFTLVNTPVAGTEQVFLNGLLQQEGAGNDYTISGDTITFTTAPDSGWKLFVNYATGDYTVAPAGSGNNASSANYQISEFTHAQQSGTSKVAYTITHNLNTLYPTVVVQSYASQGEFGASATGWVNIPDHFATNSWTDFVGHLIEIVNANTIRLVLFNCGAGSRQIRGLVKQ